MATNENAVAVTAAKIFPETPATQSKPAKIAAKTAVVPKSFPSIINPITRTNPGVISAKTLVLCRPACSRIANICAAHKIIKNFTNSLG